MELFEKVKNAIIKVQPGIDASKIIPTANLGTDLEIDSLGRVELALAIEDSFGFYLPDEELEKISTVSDIVSLVETKLRSRGA
jgi:acyl carrier protein